MRDRKLRVDSRRDGDAWVLELPARLSAHIEPTLLEAARPALAAGARLLVVDLGLVQEANSAGVGALVVLLQKAKAHGTRVRLAGASGRARILVERIGLTQHAPLFASVAEALQEER